MDWTKFYFLMAAIYITPHIYPLAAVLLGVVLFAMGVYSMRNGD